MLRIHFSWIDINGYCYVLISNKDAQNNITYNIKKYNDQIYFQVSYNENFGYLVSRSEDVYRFGPGTSVDNFPITSVGSAFKVCGSKSLVISMRNDGFSGEGVNFQSIINVYNSISNDNLTITPYYSQPNFHYITNTDVIDVVSNGIDTFLLRRSKNEVYQIFDDGGTFNTNNVQKISLTNIGTEVIIDFGITKINATNNFKWILTNQRKLYYIDNTNTAILLLSDVQRVHEGVIITDDNILIMKTENTYFSMKSKVSSIYTDVYITDAKYVEFEGSYFLFMWYATLTERVVFWANLNISELEIKMNSMGGIWDVNQFSNYRLPLDSKDIALTVGVSIPSGSSSPMIFDGLHQTLLNVAQIKDFKTISIPFTSNNFPSYDSITKLYSNSTHYSAFMNNNQRSYYQMNYDSFTFPTSFARGNNISIYYEIKGTVSLVPKIKLSSISNNDLPAGFATSIADWNMYFYQNYRFGVIIAKIPAISGSSINVYGYPSLSYTSLNSELKFENFVSSSSSSTITIRGGNNNNDNVNGDQYLNNIEYIPVIMELYNSYLNVDILIPVNLPTNIIEVGVYTQNDLKLATSQTHHFIFVDSTNKIDNTGTFVQIARKFAREYVVSGSRLNEIITEGSLYENEKLIGSTLLYDNNKDKILEVCSYNNNVKHTEKIKISGIRTYSDNIVTYKFFYILDNKYGQECRTYPSTSNLLNFSLSLVDNVTDKKLKFTYNLLGSYIGEIKIPLYFIYDVDGSKEFVVKYMTLKSKNPFLVNPDEYPGSFNTVNISGITATRINTQGFIEDSRTYKYHNSTDIPDKNHQGSFGNISFSIAVQPTKGTLNLVPVSRYPFIYAGPFDYIPSSGGIDKVIPATHYLVNMRRYWEINTNTTISLTINNVNETITRGSTVKQINLVPNYNGISELTYTLIGFKIGSESNYTNIQNTDRGTITLTAQFDTVTKKTTGTLIYFPNNNLQNVFIRYKIEDTSLNLSVTADVNLEIIDALFANKQIVRLKNGETKDNIELNWSFTNINIPLSSYLLTLTNNNPSLFTIVQNDAKNIKIIGNQIGKGSISYKISVNDGIRNFEAMNIIDVEILDDDTLVKDFSVQNSYKVLMTNAQTGNFVFYNNDNLGVDNILFSTDQSNASNTNIYYYNIAKYPDKGTISSSATNEGIFTFTTFDDAFGNDNIILKVSNGIVTKNINIIIDIRAFLALNRIYDLYYKNQIVELFPINTLYDRESVSFTVSPTVFSSSTGTNEVKSYYNETSINSDKNYFIYRENAKKSGLDIVSFSATYLGKTISGKLYINILDESSVFSKGKPIQFFVENEYDYEKYKNFFTVIQLLKYIPSKVVYNDVKNRIIYDSNFDPKTMGITVQELYNAGFPVSALRMLVNKYSIKDIFNIYYNSNNTNTLKQFTSLEYRELYKNYKDNILFDINYDTISSIFSNYTDKFTIGFPVEILKNKGHTVLQFSIYNQLYPGTKYSAEDIYGINNKYTLDEIIAGGIYNKSIINYYDNYELIDKISNLVFLLVLKLTFSDVKNNVPNITFKQYLKIYNDGLNSILTSYIDFKNSQSKPITLSAMMANLVNNITALEIYLPLKVDYFGQMINKYEKTELIKEFITNKIAMTKLLCKDFNIILLVNKGFTLSDIHDLLLVQFGEKYMINNVTQYPDLSYVGLIKLLKDNFTYTLEQYVNAKFEFDILYTIGFDIMSFVTLEQDNKIPFAQIYNLFYLIKKKVLKNDITYENYVTTTIDNPKKNHLEYYGYSLKKFMDNKVDLSNALFFGFDLIKLKDFLSKEKILENLSLIFLLKNSIYTVGELWYDFPDDELLEIKKYVIFTDLMSSLTDIGAFAENIKLSTLLRILKIKYEINQMYNNKVPINLDINIQFLKNNGNNTSPYSLTDLFKYAKLGTYDLTTLLNIYSIQDIINNYNLINKYFTYKDFIDNGTNPIEFLSNGVQTSVLDQVNVTLNYILSKKYNNITSILEYYSLDKNLSDNNAVLTNISSGTLTYGDIQGTKYFDLYESQFNLTLKEYIDLNIIPWNSSTLLGDFDLNVRFDITDSGLPIYKTFIGSDSFVTYQKIIKYYPKYTFLQFFAREDQDYKWSTLPQNSYVYDYKNINFFNKLNSYNVRVFNYFNYPKYHRSPYHPFGTGIDDYIANSTLFKKYLPIKQISFFPDFPNYIPDVQKMIENEKYTWKELADSKVIHLNMFINETWWKSKYNILDFAKAGFPTQMIIDTGVFSTNDIAKLSKYDDLKSQLINRGLNTLINDDKLSYQTLINCGFTDEDLLSAAYKPSLSFFPIQPKYSDLYYKYNYPLNILISRNSDIINNLKTLFSIGVKHVNIFDAEQFSAIGPYNINPIQEIDITDLYESELKDYLSDKDIIKKDGKIYIKNNTNQEIYNKFKVKFIDTINKNISREYNPIFIHNQYNVPYKDLNEKYKYSIISLKNAGLTLDDLLVAGINKKTIGFANYEPSELIEKCDYCVADFVIGNLYSVDTVLDFTKTIIDDSGNKKIVNIYTKYDVANAFLPPPYYFLSQKMKYNDYEFVMSYWGVPRSNRVVFDSNREKITDTADNIFVIKHKNTDPDMLYHLDIVSKVESALSLQYSLNGFGFYSLDNIFNHEYSTYMANMENSVKNYFKDRESKPSPTYYEKITIWLPSGQFKFRVTASEITEDGIGNLPVYEYINNVLQKSN